MKTRLNAAAIDAAVARHFRDTQNPQSAFEAVVRSGNTAEINKTDELPRYVNRFLQMGRADLAAEFVKEATGKGMPHVSALERIIEQNELMGVAFFTRGMTAARTVGRVVIRNAAGGVLGHGTGFMISPQLLMTNNHVLRSPAEAAASFIEFDYALGADGAPLTPVHFAFDPARFFQTSGPLDFTIVAVEAENSSGQQVEERGWMHLIADSGKAVIGEPINIIQHPGGHRQQIAIRQNKIVKVVDDFLHYTTDTMQGTSGSFCANDQWQVAGLHHAGVPRTDAMGRWLKQDGSVFQNGVDDPKTIHWIANEGVRISSIVTEMRARGLSSGDEAMFDRAFEPAPVMEFFDAGDFDGFEERAGRGPSDQSAPGLMVGPDGVARWNFQLTFGPLGGAGQMPASPAPTPKASPTPPSPVELPDSTPARAESVFEPRGIYYDAGADTLAAGSYYSGLAGSMTKKDRFWALHGLMKDSHHTVFSYYDARHDHLYPWIDRHPDETLRSIYSNDVMAEELFLAERIAVEAALSQAARVQEIARADLTPEAIELEDALLEATSTFNCEHVVPQSWFKGEAEKRAQKSDLHHLFTCESGCNSFRLNIPYSEFSSEEEAKLLAAEVQAVEALANPELEAARPMCGLRDKRRFEPTAGKGAVARATLYFLLRYPGVVGDVKSGSKKELTKSNLGVILDWAKAEPPSLYERHRNAEIAKVQGNRNPLIDTPDWLGEIAFEEGFG